MTRSSADSSAAAASAHEAPAPLPRRHALIEAAAIAIGAIITLLPFGAGLMLFFDPVIRRRSAAGESESTQDGFVRVATLDSVPADGTPQQFPVIADQHDAWNYYRNQRIGSIFLRRVGEQSVEAFNAVCPHLGCMVAFVPGRNVFHCPCHNSAFEVDGKKIDQPGRTNPSPRPLDSLEVDEKRLQESGEVWVRFLNFYTGKEEKIPKT